ncbi:MAG TPA: VOC family protein [Thermoanaerobaculia bacterium]|nr:VOC family protein [Thermoanaerobaculia bacterium]
MATESAQFGLSRIGQISVVVHDVERATVFYRDTLGMKFLFAAPGMAFFDCAGIRLMLGLPSEPQFDHPASIIYYRVDDIQAAYETLAGRGVEFEQKPHLLARLPQFDLWLAAFRDPDRNLLELMSEVPRA